MMAGDGNDEIIAQRHHHPPSWGLSFTSTLWKKHHTAPSSSSLTTSKKNKKKKKRHHPTVAVIAANKNHDVEPSSSSKYYYFTSTTTMVMKDAPLTTATTTTSTTKLSQRRHVRFSTKRYRTTTLTPRRNHLSKAVRRLSLTTLESIPEAEETEHGDSVSTSLDSEEKFNRDGHAKRAEDNNNNNDNNPVEVNDNRYDLPWFFPTLYGSGSSSSEDLNFNQARSNHPPIDVSPSTKKELEPYDVSKRRDDIQIKTVQTRANSPLLDMKGEIQLPDETIVEEKVEAKLSVTPMPVDMQEDVEPGHTNSAKEPSNQNHSRSKKADSLLVLPMPKNSSTSQKKKSQRRPSLKTTASPPPSPPPPPTYDLQQPPPPPQEGVEVKEATMAKTKPVVSVEPPGGHAPSAMSETYNQNHRPTKAPRRSSLKAASPTPPESFNVASNVETKEALLTRVIPAAKPEEPGGQHAPTTPSAISNPSNQNHPPTKAPRRSSLKATSPTPCQKSYNVASNVETKDALLTRVIPVAVAEEHQRNVSLTTPKGNPNHRPTKAPRRSSLKATSPTPCEESYNVASNVETKDALLTRAIPVAVEEERRRLSPTTPSAISETCHQNHRPTKAPRRSSLKASSPTPCQERANVASNVETKDALLTSAIPAVAMAEGRGRHAFTNEPSNQNRPSPESNIMGALPAAPPTTMKAPRRSSLKSSSLPPPSSSEPQPVDDHSLVVRRQQSMTQIPAEPSGEKEHMNHSSAYVLESHGGGERDENNDNDDNEEEQQHLQRQHSKEQDVVSGELRPYGKLSPSNTLVLLQPPPPPTKKDIMLPSKLPLSGTRESPTKSARDEDIKYNNHNKTTGTKRVAFVVDESGATVSTENDSKKQSSSTKSSSCSPTSTVCGPAPLPPSQHTNHNEVPAALQRFASKERPLKDQINALTNGSRNCLALFRQYWDADHHPMPGSMYLRFARFCGFNLREGRRVLSHFDERYLTLTASQLEMQLLSKTLFPVPGLKSFNGHDMFYMRPARFYPHTMTTQSVIDNEAYVMLTMVEKEEASTKGIGFLACMDDWTMENFSVEYCWQFMKMLQGGVPARVCLFLIVNPPSWFGTIWKIMKRMLHPAFQRKVKMIPERKLYRFLQPGFQAYLPDDMNGGTVDTNQLVKDFVAYRKFVEEKKGKPTDL